MCKKLFHNENLDEETLSVQKQLKEVGFNMINKLMLAFVNCFLKELYAQDEEIVISH